MEVRGRPEEDMLNFNPALCRAARGLLDWTQEELAGRAEVSRSTVRHYEKEQLSVHRATVAQLRRALETGGVIFARVGSRRAVALTRPEA